MKRKAPKGRYNIKQGEALCYKPQKSKPQRGEIIKLLWHWHADMPDKPGPDGNYPIPKPGKMEAL